MNDTDTQEIEFSAPLYRAGISENIHVIADYTPAQNLCPKRPSSAKIKGAALHGIELVLTPAETEHLESLACAAAEQPVCAGQDGEEGFVGGRYY